MPTNDSTKRIATAAFVTVVMLLVVGLVAPGITAWNRGRIVEQLREQIENAADTQVKVPLRQLAELGEAAIDPLVTAAASERASVSEIARQILSEKWATWRRLANSNPYDSSDRLFVAPAVALARALAEQIDNFGPAGKLWVEDLALEMIESADTFPASESARLLGDCSQILAAVPPRGPKLRTIEATIQPIATTHNPQMPAVQPKVKPLTRFSEKSLESNRPTSVLAFRSSGLASAPQPGVTGSPQSIPSDWSPRWKMNQTDRPISSSTIPTVDKLATTQPLPVKLTSRVVDIPTPQAMQSRAAELRQLSSKELLQSLRRHDLTFYETGILRSVLRERGYADAELELMQRLASPVTEVRLRLVEDVSVLPAASARRWLRWLLEDQNAEVRLRSLTALATANAPDLKDLARELAANDADPRVSQLATRLLRRTRK